MQAARLQLSPTAGWPVRDSIHTGRSDDERLHAKQFEAPEEDLTRGLQFPDCLPIFTDLSDFLGRLHPRQTRLQKHPSALGVE